MKKLIINEHTLKHVTVPALFAGQGHHFFMELVRTNGGLLKENIRRAHEELKHLLSVAHEIVESSDWSGPERGVVILSPQLMPPDGWRMYENKLLVMQYGDEYRDISLEGLTKWFRKSYGKKYGFEVEFVKNDTKKQKSMLITFKERSSLKSGKPKK